MKAGTKFSSIYPILQEERTELTTSRLCEFKFMPTAELEGFIFQTDFIPKKNCQMNLSFSFLFPRYILNTYFYEQIPKKRQQTQVGQQSPQKATQQQQTPAQNQQQPPSQQVQQTPPAQVESQAPQVQEEHVEEVVKEVHGQPEENTPLPGEEPDGSEGQEIQLQTESEPVEEQPSAH